MKKNESLNLRTLTKGSVWDLSETDIFMLWANADKDDAIQDHGQHYLDIMRAAFDIEEINIDKPEILKKYEDRGMRIGIIPIKDKEQKWAIKKRPINRVTDLTYENIHHISAAKLLEVIDRNFGGGWDSLNQGIKDIIQNGFDISTTTLPKERLRKPGSLYDIKIQDGFEVLEIEKGSWVEAIFAKAKPQATKLHMKLNESEGISEESFDEDSDEDVIVKDNYYDQDEDDMDIDEDAMTEESYRTTVEENPDELSLDAADISDEDY